jgi:hypothetical protein
VAAEYDEQRLALRGLRHDQPQPPRDLWARTAAAIEAEPARRRSARRGSGILGLTPLVGALVVAVAIGAGLLNSSILFTPLGSTTKGDDVVATPIALAGGEVQVLSRGEDGTLEILSQHVDEVWPVAADTCGLTPDLAVTTLGDLGPGADVNAVISPDHGQMVVFELGDGAQGVYVVPVKSPGTTAATATPDTLASTAAASADLSAGTTASGGPDATELPSQSTDAPATPSEPPSTTAATASVDLSADPGATPAATATPGTDRRPRPTRPPPRPTSPPRGRRRARTLRRPSRRMRPPSRPPRRRARRSR